LNVTRDKVVDATELPVAADLENGYGHTNCILVAFNLVARIIINANKLGKQHIIPPGRAYPDYARL
jgi:2-methylisocitrate lyase-like PEP mutase family enzyme